MCSRRVSQLPCPNQQQGGRRWLPIKLKGKAAVLLVDAHRGARGNFYPGRLFMINQSLETDLPSGRGSRALQIAALLLKPSFVVLSLFQ